MVSAQIHSVFAKISHDDVWVTWETSGYIRAWFVYFRILLVHSDVP